MRLGNYFIQDSDKDNFLIIVFFWELNVYTLGMFTVLPYNHYFIILTISLMSALYNQMVVSSYSFPSPQKLINKISASPLCTYNCDFDNQFLFYKKCSSFLLIKKSTVFHYVSKSTTSSIILKKLDCQAVISAGNNL